MIVEQDSDKEELETALHDQREFYKKYLQARKKVEAGVNEEPSGWELGGRLTISPHKPYIKIANHHYFHIHNHLALILLS